MRIDFINGNLPESVQIDGETYPIQYGFQAGMLFDKIRSGEDSDEDKIFQILKLYYPEIPSNTEEAINKILWFYRCGEEEKEDDDKQRYQRRHSTEPAFSLLGQGPVFHCEVFR